MHLPLPQKKSEDWHDPEHTRHRVSVILNCYLPTTIKCRLYWCIATAEKMQPKNHIQNILKRSAWVKLEYAVNYGSFLSMALSTLGVHRGSFSAPLLIRYMLCCFLTPRTRIGLSVFLNLVCFAVR